MAIMNMTIYEIKYQNFMFRMTEPTRKGSGISATKIHLQSIRLIPPLAVFVQNHAPRIQGRTPHFFHPRLRYPYILISDFSHKTHSAFQWLRNIFQSFGWSTSH
jgi:hypothetical protein